MPSTRPISDPQTARRRTRRGATAGYALLVTALSACHQTAPPNMLLYVVDTLRADAVGCYGNAAVQTAAMDRLATEGMRFTRAYANASWTRASMGSLLTGNYPTAHGAVGRPDALRPGIATLAAKLHAQGYRTAAIVANPNIGEVFGFADGFDTFVELYKRHPRRDIVRPEELIATADAVVTRAIEWLRYRPGGPFFLLVFTIDPHAPYMPPAPYDAMYDPDYTGTVDGSLKSLVGLAMSGPVPPEREIRHLRALYHGEVSFNDAQLARLLSELDQLKLTASTLVAVTSDHGEEFYEHGRRDHGHTLYEELVHVPLLLRWPGRISANQVRSGVVQLVDLYPTLCHLAGAAPPASAGRDLTDLLLGRSRDGVASMAYAEENLDNHNLRMLIRETYKLIYETGRPQPLRFDLASDPGERQPLPGEPPHDLVAAIEEIAEQNRAPHGAAVRTVPRTQLPESVRSAMEALGYGEPTPAR